MDHHCLKHVLDPLVYFTLKGCWQPVTQLLDRGSRHLNVIFDHCCPSLWLLFLGKYMAKAVHKEQKFLFGVLIVKTWRDQCQLGVG